MLEDKGRLRSESIRRITVLQLTLPPILMVGDDLEFDTTEFDIQFRQYIELTGRSIEEEFQRISKGLIRTILDITPPASGKGTRGKARKMGQNKIAADLLGGGSGRGKRRAGIFTVLSDSIIDSALESGIYEGGEAVRLWVRADGSVYGSQRHLFRPDATMSEMREHHKQYFNNGEMSRAGTYTRDIGRWKWIDQMVVRPDTFERYLKSQQRKVGIYAAGWAPAARGVGLPVPAYMRGQRALGAFGLSMNEKTLEMNFINAVGYPTLDKELKRRVQWAIDMETNKMVRQMPYLQRKHERLVN